MLKKIYIFLIVIFLFKCFEVPDKLKDVCPEGCKRYFYCDEKAKKCVFKGFFPLYPLELIELFILMVSSALATSCGIGGGAVYSSMILGVEELEPSQAFPVSNFLILFCGLVTFISFTLDKYKHPKNLFVHYDIATIFAPSMLVGAKLGTILNKILPSSLLLILLCFLIIYTGRKTYFNILKAKAKEAKIIEKEKFLEETKNSNLEEALKEMQGNNQENKANGIENNNKNSNRLLDSALIEEDNYKQDKIDFSGLTRTDNYTSINNSLEGRKSLTEEELKILNEDDDPLNWERINYILFLEVIVIIDQLIEGSSRVPSFFGITKCSFIYWLTFLIYVGIALYFVKYSINKVYEHIHIKKKLIPDFRSEVIDNVEKNLSYVVFISILAGIISSSLGIGGGMITNPVFASLGMDPKQSSSTSNFLIIVTAIASSVIFILSGQLEIEYSLCLGAFCTGSALIGSIYILSYINRTGKSSILFVIMEYFLVASFFVAIYKIFTLDLNGHSFLGSLFVTKPYC